MPTGYTAYIEEGISFEDFAMTCARAFGALVTLRDLPHSEPIPDVIKLNPYYVNAVETAARELDQLTRMHADELADAAQKEHDDSVANAVRYTEKKRELRKKYEAMLIKVNSWAPPTPEHVELKKFMRQQIEDSIKFDCDTTYSPAVAPLLSPSEWRAKEYERRQEHLNAARVQLHKEEQRARERTAWIKALRKSLE